MGVLPLFLLVVQAQKHPLVDARDGSGVFGYNPESILVSESGIPAAAATTHARVYVDLSRSHNTGLALANLADAEADIEINAFQMDGVTGIGRRTTLRSRRIMRRAG